MLRHSCSIVCSEDIFRMQMYLVLSGVSPRAEAARELLGDLHRLEEEKPPGVKLQPYLKQTPDS